MKKIIITIPIAFIGIILYHKFKSKKVGSYLYPN